MKVLVVNDRSPHMGDPYYEKQADQLEDRGFEVLLAATSDEAWDIYAELGNEIDAVILDCDAPGDFPYTFPLVQRMVRKGFTGHIVAALARSINKTVMMQAGCRHFTAKEDAAGLVASLLLRS